MKIWSDSEVKALFGEVEKTKAQQSSLKKAFIIHAQKFGRKQNSVRNYYYHEVDNLLKDSQRCNRLGIDISVHDKTHFESFDKLAEENLFEEIEKLLAEGLSVRSACLKLSGGDLTLMTRYQNKYQNMKKKLSAENVIPFRQKLLTESDINSLFLGLVKLIKKTALEEEKSKDGQLLKRAFEEIGRKDKQLEELKNKFEMLKLENEALKTDFDKRAAFKSHLDKNRLQKKEGDTKRI